MKSIFEQQGGSYTMQGDYRLPNLHLSIEEEYHIGVWGQRRLNYLKHYRKVLYYNLLTSANSITTSQTLKSKRRIFFLDS